jgi:hypothetical protein
MDVSIDVPYQELMGCLVYIAVTSRPDIAFVCSALSQFNSCYQDEHWKYLKRILKIS